MILKDFLLFALFHIVLVISLLILGSTLVVLTGNVETVEIYGLVAIGYTFALSCARFVVNQRR